jgi:uncharacterized membrane protein
MRCHDDRVPPPGSGGRTLGWAAGLPLVVLVLGILALVASCGQGDKTLLEADPGAVSAAPTYEDVRAIVDLNCVPCHKGKGSDLTIRPNLETCEGLLGDLGRVVQDAVILEKMPPGAWPRLSEEDKLTITRWIENGACAPCNSGTCP